MQVLQTPSRIHLNSGGHHAPLLQTNLNTDSSEPAMEQCMEFQLLSGNRGHGSKQAASINRAAAARRKQREILKPPVKQLQGDRVTLGPGTSPENTVPLGQHSED